MRVTQRKGDIATARAVARFTSMGCDVSIPLTESAAYDLIVDDGETLVRVQCKFTSSSRRQVQLRNVHSNATGYVVKKAQAGDYDWLYVLDSEDREYLVKECFAGRNSLTLNDELLIGAVAESGLLQLP